MTMLNKRKTVHYSFRINSKVLTELEEESGKKGVSTSNLVNEVLEAYTRRFKYFEDLGFVPVPKDFLRKWLPRINEKSLSSDATELGSVIAREYISYFFQDCNNDTLIEFLNLWLGRLGPHQHKIVNDRFHWFAVNHDINMKFSIHLREFLTALIESIIAKPVKFIEVTPNVVTFSFEI
ncbi:MAG TPA: hypothetical protein VND01_00475 [Candidatus Acidoferrales bacterium]|nr:hypothetical protein [Candidatus Acidoferrales bacterium]